MEVVNVAGHRGARSVAARDVYHQLPGALGAGFRGLLGAFVAGVGGQHLHAKERVHQVASPTQVRNARGLLQHLQWKGGAPSKKKCIGSG